MNNLAIPYVGAIIERENNGSIELLMQTRWKPKSDPVYSGTLEFPAGVLDVQYESVFDALKREIKEECGLKLKSIKQRAMDVSTTTGKDDEIIGFLPFYCTQQMKNGRPWIGFVFVCEVEEGEPVAQESETRNPQWMKYEDVKEIVISSPDKVFGLELPALIYYFNQAK